MATFTLKLDRIAQHVELKPGAEIKLSGSFVSRFDGSIVDAATTTWPGDTPGGAGVDPRGLVDFEAGGLRLTSRDPKTHEVVAIATGKEAPGCAKANVAPPCMILNTVPQAQSRLITMDEWSKSLDGAITVELTQPPPPSAMAPVGDALTSPIFIGGAAAVGLAAVVGLAWIVNRRQKLSAAGQMKVLVSRVSAKLKSADAALGVTLAPIMKKTLATMNERKVSPTSKEGVRIREVLLRVEAKLDETKENSRAAKEQEAADELVSEMEDALAAAEEAMRS